MEPSRSVAPSPDLAGPLTPAPAPGRRRTARWLIPVAAGGGAVALAAALAGVPGGEGGAPAGSNRPPVLRLTGSTGEVGAGTAASGREPAGSGGSSSAGGAASPWRLDTSLPGGPSTAAVHRPAGGADLAQVQRLARALGLSAPVQARANGWTVGSAPRSLAVNRTTGAWRFGTAGSACWDGVDPLGRDTLGKDTLGKDSMTVSCAAADVPSSDIGSVGSSRSGPGKPTSSRTARALVRPVLDAVGLSAAGARVVQGNPAVVTVDPVVDGLPTSGASTTIGIEFGKIAKASGWLAVTRPGAAYPLISARQAYDQLVAQPLIEPMLLCVDCVKQTQRIVTGVRLGLLRTTDASGPLLVPAWLFDARGLDAPLAVVAVAPDYLAAPEPGPQPEPDGGSGGGGGSDGSTGGAVEPQTAAPPVSGEAAVRAR